MLDTYSRDIRTSICDRVNAHAAEAQSFELYPTATKTGARLRCALVAATCGCGATLEIMRRIAAARRNAGTIRTERRGLCLEITVSKYTKSELKEMATLAMVAREQRDPRYNLLCDLLSMLLQMRLHLVEMRILELARQDVDT